MNTLNNVANALVTGACICGLWLAYSMAPVDWQHPSLLYGGTLAGSVAAGWILTR